MNRKELIAWALRHGYEQDRWGHYQKTTTNGKRYRLKFQPTSLKKEVYDETIDSAFKWRRVSSQFFTKLSIDSDDKLVGMVKEKDIVSKG